MKRNNLGAWAVIVISGAGILAWTLRYRAWFQTTPPPPPVQEPTKAPPLAGKTPNYLVIDIDTLSPDHVGAMRDGQAVTPVIDGLSARGIRFTNAISQSGWTLPAVASLLTGALPVPILLREHAIPWRTTGARDLAEVLGIYGYQTGAFWQKTLAGGILDQATRFFNRSSTQTDALPTEEVRTWLGTTPEPFFAFVHEVDLNFPQAMPGPYIFDDPAWDSGWMAYLEGYQHLSESVGGERAKAAVLAHYDGVLHNYDAGIGKILETLTARGVADRTVILVTSNHSQDFFHHTIVDHGLLYDTNLRIPLVIVDPESPWSGVVVDQIVQTVDIAPTLLSRASIPIATSMIGQPLLPPPGQPGSNYQVRPVFSLVDDCNASLRTADAKLIIRDRRSRWDASKVSDEAAYHGVPLAGFAAAHGIADLPECSKIPMKGAAEKRSPTTLGDLVIELYDLRSDPDEVHNIVNERTDVALQLLVPLLRTMNAQREAGAAAPRSPLGPDQVRQIQQQGYWGLVDDSKPAPPKKP